MNFVALATLLSAASEPAHAQVSAAPLIEKRGEEAPDRCNFNSIMIGPDEQIVVWEDPRPQFVRPLIRRPRSEFIVLSGSALAYFSVKGDAGAIGWTSKANQLDMIVDGRTWVRYDVRESRTIANLPRFGWNWVEVKAARWDALQLLASDVAVFSAIEQPPERPTRIFKTVNVAERVTYHFMISEPGDRVHSLPGVPTAPSAFVLPGRIDQVLEQGLPTIRQAAAFRGPIYDPSSGKIVGEFTPDAATIWGTSNQNVVPRVGTGLVKAVSKVSRTTALLTATPDGTHWIVRSGTGGADAIRLCGPAATSLTAGLSRAIRYGGDGEKGSPALLHRARLGQVSKALIVRFHGGPFASVLDDYPSLELQALFKSGFDVLEPDYPSSRSRGDESSPMMSPAKIKASNDALVRWARAIGYSRVVVVGESLGALPAIDLALRYAGLVAPPILIAPLSRLDRGKTIVGETVAADHIQARAEAKAFGASTVRARLENWVHRSFQKLCTRGLATSVYMGSADQIVGGDRVQNCLRPHANYLKDATHGSIIGDPGLWPEVQASIGKYVVGPAQPRR